MLLYHFLQVVTFQQLAAVGILFETLNNRLQF